MRSDHPKPMPLATPPKAYRGLVWTGIAGMAEEALRVLRGDGVERRPERLMQGVGGAGCDLAQPPLHLGPNWLDWVQIRRVRRQIVVAEPGAIEKLPHGFRLVSREVVH